MRRKVLFIASHLGHGNSTPLGGGAAVAKALMRCWSRDGRGLRVTALGSGPESPDPDADYAALLPPLKGGDSIARLSESGYAGFCRWFAEASARWILERKDEFPPDQTVLISNDVSESPDWPVLAREGYPIASIWHVDVVDYFNRLYLKDAVPAQGLTGFYEGLRRIGLSRLVPRLLRLVFEKERQSVYWSSRLIFPSEGMARRAQELYAKLLDAEEFGKRSRVVGWGAWDQELDLDAVEKETERLRAHYQIGPEDRVLATISRVSPEKGLDILLKAVGRIERMGAREAGNLCLLICGEPAFMRGAAYARAVKMLARRLGKTRVFFPGHLSALQKRAVLSLSDLFISPSIHESYGLTIVEAMAAGRPVLSSDHHGARDLIRPDCGSVVSYFSGVSPAEALAAGLLEALKDAARLEAMGRAARRRAESLRFEKAAGRVLEAALEL